MNTRRLSGALNSARTVVVAVVLLGAFAFALLNGPHLEGTRSPKFELTSASGAFSVAGTFETTATNCSGSQVVYLAPDVPYCLRYTVHNTLTVSITVTSLEVTSVSFTPKAPETTCRPNLATFTKTTFTGSPTLTVGPDSATTQGEPIKWLTESTENSCETGLFTFTFSGSATYTDTTTTTLTGTLSGTSSTRTLTAKVSPGNGATDSSGLSGESVTFDSCTTATCTTTNSLGTVALTTTTGMTKVATATKTVTLTTGTQYYEAKYAGTTTDFSPSTSGPVELTVTPS